MTPAQMAVRRRLLEDFAYYSQNALQIRTKPNPVTGKSDVSALVLNAAQLRLQEVIDRQLAARGFVRIVILKGRQMGLSTHVGGWLYWWVSQRKAQKAMVVAHKGDSTQTLFDMTRRFHDRCPEILKPSTRYSSRRELVFDKLDSSYAVVTAGGDGIGRSETITCAHLSELAFWPKGVAQENFSGLMDTVPSGAGTAVFIESTANGMSGLYYDLCKRAQAGDSDWEFIFLPWFIDPNYRAAVPAHFERTPNEQDLVDRYGLDDEQLMFRRSRIAEKGVELFKQEYPCNAAEAFLTSGRPVFHPERLVDMRKLIRKPIMRMALESAGETGPLQTPEWQEHPRGELHVYRDHDPAETYYLGADVGQGVQKDASVAQIFDSKLRQAAVWRSERADPALFGQTLASLGRRYNDAQIIIEANGPGVLTNHVVHKECEYPWITRR